MATDADSWFPLFEFQDWIYQSVLLLPTSEEDSAPAGSAISSRKWAKGKLLCGQAFCSADGYTLDGTLSFRPGVELRVSAKGDLGSENNPVTFKATGVGTEGPTKGAVYELLVLV